MRDRKDSFVAYLVLLLCVIASPVVGQSVEWPSYASDVSGSKYSPLDQINPRTVNGLEIVWRRPVIPDAIRNGSTIRGTVASQNTPLMAGGLLYVSTGLGTVAALDASTGEVVWNDAVPVYSGNETDRRARQTRGVAYWTDGNDARVLAARGPKLVALNARTGERYADFGTDGEVDIRDDLVRDWDYYYNSAPLVVNDIVIIGSFVPDILNNQMPAMKEAPRGDVRAYDVRTGELRWTFYTIPREGEFGVETWGIDPDSDQPSWVYSGNTNMWAHPTADPELGYAYLPLSTPSSDYYG